MTFRRTLMFGGILLPLGGCSMETTYKDVSLENQYKEQIGAHYRVVDTLFAFGVRRNSLADATYVVLQPPPGFTGSEVEFKRLIPVGTILVVQKVFMTNRWFDPPLSFQVKLLNFELESDVPIRIDLMQGNEVNGTNKLNPKLYQKLLDQ